MREVVPHSYLNWYLSAAHGPFSQFLRVMQTDKKHNQPSSGSKGAKERDTEERRFSPDEQNAIDTLSMKVPVHTRKYLDRFPHQSIFICEHQQNPILPVLHSIRDLTDEYCQFQAQDELLLMLENMLYRNHAQTGSLSVAEDAYLFWRSLYRMVGTIYDHSAAIDSAPDIETVIADQLR